MNNEQFRKLMLAGASEPPINSRNGASPPRGASGVGGLSSLGSRQKSSIPMTPRSVAGSKGIDFARQVAERNAGNKPEKKFRSWTPKGVGLAEGYVDRARTRVGEEEDERAARIKALEESLENEEIDQATFERLRDEIAGGDLSSTHLIKGLDFKLLERIRKGEDVYGERPAERVESGPEEDFDDAFERIEGAEVVARTKEKVQKKGQLSTVPVAAGKKRTRDQILAEMKAARAAAKAKEESALGSRFKKIGAQKVAGSRTERDSKGREVLIIVDEDGHEKRKVRKVAADETKEREAFVPDKKAEPLGMEVPEFYRKKQQEEAEEDKEVKIFDDAGSDYDPLAGIQSESDSEPDEGEVEDGQIPEETRPASGGGGAERTAVEPGEAMPPPPKPQAAPRAKDYFAGSKSGLVSEQSQGSPSLSDPAVLAALRKAKTLSAAAKTEEEERDAEREARLKKLLESSERDAADMDIGFGTNRIADEEESEETHAKLSTWGDEGDEGGRGGGKTKRKRGPKKRKGDGNNAADVMRVLEQRKGAGS